MIINKETMLIEDFQMNKTEIMHLVESLIQMNMYGDISDNIMECFNEWFEFLDIREENSMIMLSTVFPIKIFISVFVNYGKHKI